LACVRICRWLCAKLWPAASSTPRRNSGNRAARIPENQNQGHPFRHTINNACLTAFPRARTLGKLSRGLPPFWSRARRIPTSVGRRVGNGPDGLTSAVDSPAKWSTHPGHPRHALCAGAPRRSRDLLSALPLVLPRSLPCVARRPDVLGYRWLSSLFLASLVQAQPRLSVRHRLHGHDLRSERRALVGGASPSPSSLFGPGRRPPFADSLWFLLVAYRLDHFGPLQRNSPELHCRLRQIPRTPLAQQIPHGAPSGSRGSHFPDRRLAPLHLGLLPEHRAALARHLHHQFPVASLRLTALRDDRHEQEQLGDRHHLLRSQVAIVVRSRLGTPQSPRAHPSASSGAAAGPRRLSSPGKRKFRTPFRAARRPAPLWRESRWRKQNKPGAARSAPGLLWSSTPRKKMMSAQPLTFSPFSKACTISCI